MNIPSSVQHPNIVHVTLATLNNPGAFSTSNGINGFIMAGWKVPMTSAVFCGKVLGTKVIALHIKHNHKIKKIGQNTEAIGICLDDGTGLHTFIDRLQNVKVNTGDYIKIFTTVKPCKEGNKIQQNVIYNF
jgi:hypothetical protein